MDPADASAALLRPRVARDERRWSLVLALACAASALACVAATTRARASDGVKGVLGLGEVADRASARDVGRAWIVAARERARGGRLVSDASLEPTRRTRDDSCAVRFKDANMALCRCKSHNSGDESGPEVARRAAEHYFGGCSADALPERSTSCFGDEEGNCLITIGSVFLKARSGDHVWGTGVWHPRELDKRAETHSGVVVHGVRGPRTKELLHEKYFSSSESNERVDVAAIGDPGFLVAFTHPELAAGVLRKQRCHVRHHTDSAGAPEGVKIINAAHREWKGFVKDIASCTHVFSSSLHGLVFADSFGIPSRWFQQKNSATEHREGHFKYLDYLEMLPRDARWLTPSASIHDLTRDDAYPAPLTESQRRDVAGRIVERFPFHLFEKVPSR